MSRRGTSRRTVGFPRRIWKQTPRECWDMRDVAMLVALAAAMVSAGALIRWLAGRSGKPANDGSCAGDSPLVVASHISHVEAEMARVRLESNGIRCSLQGEIASRMDADSGALPIELVVPARDAERATRLLRGQAREE